VVMRKQPDDAGPQQVVPQFINHEPGQAGCQTPPDTRITEIARLMWPLS